MNRGSVVKHDDSVWLLWVGKREYVGTNSLYENFERLLEGALLGTGATCTRNPDEALQVHPTYRFISKRMERR